MWHWLIWVDNNILVFFQFNFHWDATFEPQPHCKYQNLGCQEAGFFLSLDRETGKEEPPKDACLFNTYPHLLPYLPIKAAAACIVSTDLGNLTHRPLSYTRCDWLWTRVPKVRHGSRWRNSLGLIFSGN